MNKFYIDNQYLTDVTYENKYYTVDIKNPTPDDLVTILKGHHEVITVGHRNHPEFQKLREYLGESGFIKIENGWWNGDYVLKPFKLNDVLFKRDDKFVCAAAMKHFLELKGL